jgi:hypothetical protein
MLNFARSCAALNLRKERLYFLPSSVNQITTGSRTTGIEIPTYQCISLKFAVLAFFILRQLLKCLSSIGVQILKEEIELFNSGVSALYIG